MNENYIDIELGGWNIPEAITVEAEPVEARDFSDFELRRENIRYEARGKSFEIECPSGFSGIEAIVCWCDAGGGWHREAFESFLDARGRLDGLLRGEAVMAYVQRTVCMNTADAIDPGIQPVEVGLAAGEWVMYQLQKGRE